MSGIFPRSAFLVSTASPQGRFVVIVLPSITENSTVSIISFPEIVIVYSPRGHLLSTKLLGFSRENDPRPKSSPVFVLDVCMTLFFSF